jgi:hypothetical protein
MLSALYVHDVEVPGPAVGFPNTMCKPSGDQRGRPDGKGAEFEEMPAKTAHFRISK